LMGPGQRARGSRHQGMGWGTGYIAKGFNFFKQPPKFLLALPKAEMGGERG
jgi:hypothetical protein